MYCCAGRFFETAVFILLLLTSGNALTRWSSVKFVPDADLLEAGIFVAQTEGYYFSDIIDGGTVKPAGLVDFGITEWINIEAGYTGGFNLGLKARLLGETKPWMPSAALGVRNIFSHYEAWIFDRDADELGNEVYLVLGKSVEAARLRFHVGIQSIPGNNSEIFNPFIVLEKYFGGGIYVTAEAHRRDRLVHPSIFASWRFWKRCLEVSIGVVDISGMFMSDEVSPNGPFYKSGDSRFVRPGVWSGLRFRGGLNIGKFDGLTGLEKTLYDQSESIKKLQKEIDSVRAILSGNSERIENLKRTVSQIADSSLTEEQRLKLLAIDRLAYLRSLYNTEPFEPEEVKKAMTELTSNRNRILPALYEIINDPVQENKIRTLAINALGEIGTEAAADIIIEQLGRSPAPEIAIECLIALGKMKETRAVYLIQHLTNDPNDDVAFTAAEVLRKIEKETGVAVTSAPSLKKSAPPSVPEKKIGAGGNYEGEEKRSSATFPDKVKAGRAGETKNNDSLLQKIDKPYFQETASAADVQKNKTVNTIESQADGGYNRSGTYANDAARREAGSREEKAHKDITSAGNREDQTSVDTETVKNAPPERKDEKAAVRGKKNDDRFPETETTLTPAQDKTETKRKKSETKPSGKRRIDTSKETW